MDVDVVDERQWHFTVIENSVLENTSLSTYEKLVYIVLCKFANKSKECYPSYKTIAELSGCSKRKAIDVIQSLADKGLIKIAERKDKGMHCTNLFVIGGSEYSAPGSECGAPGSECGALGSACGAPGVVHVVHQGSACRAPELEPYNENHIELEPKNKYADDVRMTETEYKKLVDKYGEDNVKKMIEKLDAYKGSKGKKYKSDYKAILSWVAGEILPGTKQPDQGYKAPRTSFNSYDQRKYTPEKIKELENSLLGDGG